MVVLSTLLLRLPLQLETITTAFPFQKVFTSSENRQVDVLMNFRFLTQKGLTFQSNCALLNEMLTKN